MFQRRQYHLGLHDTLEAATEARAEAEKHLYGPFLEWWEEYMRKRQE